MLRLVCKGVESAEGWLWWGAPIRMLRLGYKGCIGCGGLAVVGSTNQNALNEVHRVCGVCIMLRVCSLYRVGCIVCAGFGGFYVN